MTIPAEGAWPAARARLTDPPPATDSLLRPRADQAARLPANRPLLAVVVDVEEEFDWAAPFDPANTSVTALRHIHRAQRLFDRHGLRPTYAVDYPVATQAEGYEPLREILADGRCHIGAQLHPWVTPPAGEIVGKRHSFPGNLPPGLERAKLVRLKAALEDTFGLSPLLYKAGRYGVGPNTAGLLHSLGFRIDASLVPSRDYRPLGGPDFRDSPLGPFWFGPGRSLLEIPVTCGFIGLAGGLPQPLAARLTAPALEPFGLPAVLSRTGLLGRVQLTPEGVPLAEAMALTRALLRRGTLVFQLCFHSPSLAVGHTPYVRTRTDLDRFLGWLADYLDFFFGEVGGAPTTPADLLSLAEANRGAGPP